MDSFINYLQQISPLSENAISRIKEKSVVKTYPKGHILVQNLAICDKYFFIVKGLLRVYYEKGNREVTDWFGEENSLTGPLVSGLNLPNAIHSIELLEDTTLIQVSLWDLEMLCTEFHEIERLGRMIAIQTAIKLQYKIECMLFLTAKERYEEFIKNHPTILQRASLGHIASYLGMNQVTLSRARANKL